MSQPARRCGCHPGVWKRGAAHRACSRGFRSLLDAKSNGKPVSSTAETGGHERVGPDELLAAKCNLLVPAALENMIHEGNAKALTTPLELELANGSITPESDEMHQGSRRACRLPHLGIHGEGEPGRTQQEMDQVSRSLDHRRQAPRAAARGPGEITLAGTADQP